MSADNSLAARFPTIAKQWHPTRNAPLLPSQVTAKSGRRVWWKCSRGPDHEWIASVADRHRFGCPCCAGKKACKATCLTTLMPRLARQWHPTRNAPLTPRDVTPQSNKKVWWRCSRDSEHEWPATIANRARSPGCPVCRGIRASPSTSLAALAPEVAREFHPTKNARLRPEDLPVGSDHLVWWRCPKGPDHEWRTRVRKRTMLGRGCPFCGGARTSLQTSLHVRAPRLAAEWHPTRNGALTPRQVGIGSKQYVWWRCRRHRHHEWQAIVKVRMKGDYGCPFCAGFRASPEHSLATTHPALARQWHPTRNGKVTACDVLPGAAKIAWWKCRKGSDHEWRAQVSERTRSSGACPFCSGLRLSVTNSVVKLAPAMARWWHPTRNGRKTAAGVRLASTRPVWWKCPEGPDHEWRREPNVQKKFGCPFCSKHRVSVTNSLATRYPKIARFWHPTKNGSVTPDTIIAGATRRYWWRCDRGHEWQAAPGARIRTGGDCSYCPRRRRKVALTYRPHLRVRFPSDFE